MVDMMNLGQAIDNLTEAAREVGRLEGSQATEAQLQAALEKMTRAHDMVFSMLDRVTNTKERRS